MVQGLYLRALLIPQGALLCWSWCLSLRGGKISKEIRLGLGPIVLSRLNNSGGTHTAAFVQEESLGDGDGLSETQVRQVYGDDPACFTQTVPL